jgi:D-alanine-D-alanine ligase
MRIGITYNLKSEVDNICPEHLLMDDAFEEFDTEGTIDAIKSVLERNGHSVIKLGWGKAAIKLLLSESPDFVFNIAEGYSGRNREAQTPALLEMLDIPHSGSDALTLSLTLDKITSKKILYYYGIKNPNYCVVNSLVEMDIADAQLKYPLFVKPAWEGSSKGIQHNSKVNRKEELMVAVGHLLKYYPNQPILVEEYISGREFTVGVLGNQCPYILGVMEISPRSKEGEDFFYSREVKRDWQNRVIYRCPPEIDNFLKKDLERVAKEAFVAFECRDVSRVDMRVDEFGNVYFIEINPLPGLSPEYADLVIMARRMGWTYEKLILTVLNHALSRYNMPKVSVDEKI